MPPRIGHKKSRNGCVRCKRRRVKCDEKTPCGNCVRHGCECSLITGLSTPDTSEGLVNGMDRGTGNESSSHESDVPMRSRSTSLQASTPHTASPNVLVNSNPFPTTDPNPFSMFHRVMVGDEPSWLQDLELMHHYTLRTSSTMSTREDCRHIWCDVVPRLAVSHNFLMHGILALAALHLAYLHPQVRHTYAMISTHHQNLAIGTFRSVLPQITRENSDAFFALSGVLSLFAFATSADLNRPPLQISDVAETFQLVRGTRDVLSQSWEWLNEGPLQTLLVVEKADRSTPLRGEYDAHLDELAALVLRQGYSDETRTILSSSIQKLTETYNTMAANVDIRGNADLLTWMFACTAPAGYISLVSAGQPLALLILAYFCVLQKPWEEVWFMKGWSPRVMAAIERALDLEWKEYLRWPAAKIADGWNATAKANRTL